MFEPTPRSKQAARSSGFREIFRNHPAGVALVTADPGSGPVAMTATSVSSVNSDPPLLMFSASERSSSTPTLQKSNSVVVHMLDSTNIRLAQLGSTSGIDRFEDTSAWRRLPTGEPYFVDAKTWVRGRIVDRMSAPGATVFLVEVIDLRVGECSDALVYHNRSWHGVSSHSEIVV